VHGIQTHQHNQTSYGEQRIEESGFKLLGRVTGHFTYSPW